jgi:hypothetical protein
MSGVFRNIDPPPPHRPPSVYAFGAGVGHTRWLERGWEVNSSEDARHCSLLCTLYMKVLSVYTNQPGITEKGWW